MKLLSFAPLLIGLGLLLAAQPSRAQTAAPTHSGSGNGDNASLLSQFEAKAKTGDPFADCTLAQMYQTGEDVPKIDLTAALSWAEKCRKNSGRAGTLGRLQSEAVRADELAARISAGQHDYKAMHQWIMRALWDGSRLNPTSELADPISSIPWIDFAMAYANENGWGTPRSFATAAFWADAAIHARTLTEIGPNSYMQHRPPTSIVAPMEYMLGKLAYYGAGVPRDPATGVQYFHRAAVTGYGPAEVRLADAYYDGIGVAKDVAKTIKWLQMAANEGDTEGETALGKAYLYGVGVKKDQAKGLKLIRQAAAHGYPPAQSFLRSLAPK